MLFYSDIQIQKELANITFEEESLEPACQTYLDIAFENPSKDDKIRVRNGLIDLYEKKRDLEDRLSVVIKAIDERWLSSANGEESIEMTILYNEAIDKKDEISGQTYQIRQLINDLF